METRVFFPESLMFEKSDRSPRRRVWPIAIALVSIGVAVGGAGGALIGYRFGVVDEKNAGIRRLEEALTRRYQKLDTNTRPPIRMFDDGFRTSVMGESSTRVESLYGIPKHLTRDGGDFWAGSFWEYQGEFANRDGGVSDTAFICFDKKGNVAEVRFAKSEKVAIPISK